MSRLLALLMFSLLFTTPAFAEDDAAKEARSLRNLKQLTKEGAKSGEAYFSPDGKQVIFQSVRKGCPHYQIYIMNVDGSGQRLVSSGKGKTTCAYFDPKNPKRFLYSSSHLDPRSWPPVKKKGRGYSWDFEPSMDIFLAESKTGKIVKRLTSAKGYDAEGSFSPDGSKICFMSTRDGGAGEIYVMDSDGGNQRRLTFVKGYDGGPFFSPDGKRIVFRGFRKGSGAIAHIFTIGVDGKDERELTRLDRINWAPIFHPSGRWIIYAANVGARHNFELFLMKADGSGEVQITHNPGFDGLPVFSPDGKKLMWTTNRVGKASQVFIADFVVPPESAFKPQPKTVPAPHGAGKHGAGKGSTNPHGAASRPAKEGQGTSPHGAASRPAKHGGKAPTSRPAHSGGLRPKTDKRFGKLPTVHGRHGSSPAFAALPGAKLIKGQAMIEDIKVLASDDFAGREAGTSGGEKAARFVAARFAKLGLESAGSDGFRQVFAFAAGTKILESGNALVLRFAGRRRALVKGVDFKPLRYSASAVTGRVGVVFCGYGIQAKKKNYDDLAGLALEGKIALVLTRGPRSGDGGSFGAKRPTRHDDLRGKIANLRDAGAVGVVFIRAKGKGWLRLDGGDPTVPVAQLKRAAASEFLAAGGIDLAKAMAGIDRDLRPRSAVVEDCGAALAVSLERRKKQGCNIVAKLKGSDPKLAGEVIVIGAHFDHLGMGAEGSLAKTKGIHNGADDNASGSAGLLAIAAAFRKAGAPKRSILFAAFDAEEKGLLGSKALLAAKELLGGAKVVVMINMDMIGRLTKRPVVVSGVGSSSSFRALVTEGAHRGGLDLALDPDGQGPSDHASYYSAGVPVLALFTQTHDDYHRPSDDWEKINVPGLERVTRLGYFLARRIGDGPRLDFKRVKGAGHPGKSRVKTGESMPYFGSIPDYAQSDAVKGVLLSGARAGSPAQEAGLQAGDVIVSFGGRRIANIYDYVAALRGSESGQKVAIVVLRKGRRVTLSATLRSR